MQCCAARSKRSSGSLSPPLLGALRRAPAWSWFREKEGSLFDDVAEIEREIRKTNTKIKDKQKTNSAINDHKATNTTTTTTRRLDPFDTGTLDLGGGRRDNSPIRHQREIWEINDDLSRTSNEKRSPKQDPPSSSPRTKQQKHQEETPRARYVPSSLGPPIEDEEAPFEAPAHQPLEEPTAETPTTEAPREEAPITEAPTTEGPPIEGPPPTEETPAEVAPREEEALQVGSAGAIEEEQQLMEDSHLGASKGDSIGAPDGPQDVKDRNTSRGELKDNVEQLAEERLAAAPTTRGGLDRTTEGLSLGPLDVPIATQGNPKGPQGPREPKGPQGALKEGETAQKTNEEGPHHAWAIGWGSGFVVGLMIIIAIIAGVVIGLYLWRSTPTKP